MAIGRSAAGQMAGYLYQLERALYWLSKGEVTLIGIETEDDVVATIELENLEEEIREQTKSSLNAKKFGFGDHSSDFWKTLAIWLPEFEKAEGHGSSIRFSLVTTNNVLEDQIAFKIAAANDLTTAKALVSELRGFADRLPETVREWATTVLSYDDETMARFITRIELSDASTGSFGLDLDSQIIANCHIPPEHDSQQVLDSVRGWLQNSVLTKWRQKQPALIDKESFTRILFRANEQQSKRALCELAEELILVSDAERAAEQESVFVHQIKRIYPEDTDLIVEAINDYIRADREIVRLAQEGEITEPAVSAFRARLVKRWKSIFRVKKNEYQIVTGDEANAAQCGVTVFETTMEHREPLGERQTVEPYFTKGIYHALAKAVAVGWHPAFKRLFK